jgi:signal transduction histidine kinase
MAEGDEKARRQEAQVALDRDRFRDFAESSADWYWEQDADLRFVEITGVDLEHRLTPLPLRFIGFTRREMNPPGVSEEQWAAHEADLAARRPFRNFRYERVELSGRRRYLSVSGLPIFDADGVFRGYRGVGRDETEMREALAKLQAQTEELRLARLDAESASRAKTSFLANMSHEFRTPLNAIMGFAEMIRDRRFGDDDIARYAEYAGDIVDCGEALLQMINQILDLSRIEARRYEVSLEAIDLKEFLTERVRLFALQAERQQLQLIQEIEPGLTVTTDRRALSHIVNNLLSNAVKFTGRGGLVELTAGRQAEAGLLLTVRDTGVGMSAAFLQRALRPFEQMETGLNRRHGGTGLGLSIASGYAEILGARLQVSSEEGVGTRCRLTFPA